MNVLYLTLGIVRDIHQTDINSSLLREFAKHGHEVYIISPVEHKEKTIIPSISYGHVHMHYAKIGNYFNTQWIEKGITTLFLTKHYINTIKTELNGINFDLVLYTTPPVTFAGVLKDTKKHYKEAKTFLLLKDIWPKSIADLDTLRPNSFIYRYFKFKEQQMYRYSDYIGCMSPACVKYLLDHNSYIKKETVTVCPNALNFDDEWNHIALTDQEKQDIRKQYSIPQDKVVFAFAGNIGHGHDPDFLEEVINLNEERNDSFLLFVGKGIYYNRIKAATEQKQNTKIIPFLPQDQYLRLMAACDVGLITLDHRFTCPNYPSRLLSYLVDCKPVLIAQDSVSDVGPIAEENGYGYYCESTDSKKFVSLMDRFLDTGKRRDMGLNGYKFLRENYNTARVYTTIMKLVSNNS